MSIERSDAVAGLNASQRRRLTGIHDRRNWDRRRNSGVEQQSHIDSVGEERVHRDTSKHDEQPRDERFRLEPARFRNRLGTKWNHRVWIEFVLRIGGSDCRVLAAALEKSRGLVFP